MRLKISKFTIGFVYFSLFLMTMTLLIGSEGCGGPQSYSVPDFYAPVFSRITPEVFQTTSAVGLVYSARIKVSDNSGSPKVSLYAKKYGAASVRFEAGDFPNGSRDKRVEGIRNFLRDLNALMPDIKKTPDKISSELSKNIKKYYDELESAQAEIQRKPYPLKVASRERSPGNPGGLADKFALLRGGVAAPVETKAWFTHDDASLLVKVECSEPDLKNILSSRDERETGAKDESIDLFILPGGSSEYHKISAHISGTVTRERLPLGRADTQRDESAASKTDDVVCKVTKGDDSWTVELAIPKKSVGLGARPSGEKMHFNIVRNRNCSKEPGQHTFAPLWRRSLKTPFVFWAAELE